MRATVDAKALSAAMTQVEKLIPKSGFLVLEGMLVSFSHGVCSLTGSDLTTWLTVKQPAGGDDFSFVFPHPKTVLNVCRYYDGELTVVLCGARSDAMETCLSKTCGMEPNFTKVDLFCGQRAGEFDIIPAKDYPEPPEQETEVSFQANAGALLKRIERVKYAVREPVDSSYRTEQTCVQFSGNDVFTVDGCRAACDTDPSLRFPRPFLTWGKGLSYLKLMGDREASVYLDTGHIWFCTEDVSLCCRREGMETFPLRNAVPKRFSEEFTVSPGEFLRELDYLQGFQPKKNRLTAVFCGGRLFLDKAESKCSTSVEIEGESELAVGFDQRYMKDALTQFKGEPRVRVKLTSGGGPIIIEAEGRNDFAMVLPVRPRIDMAA